MHVSDHSADRRGVASHGCCLAEHLLLQGRQRWRWWQQRTCSGCSWRERGGAASQSEVHHGQEREEWCEEWREEWRALHHGCAWCQQWHDDCEHQQFRGKVDLLRVRVRVVNVSSYNIKIKYKQINKFENDPNPGTAHITYLGMVLAAFPGNKALRPTTSLTQGTSKGTWYYS